LHEGSVLPLVSATEMLGRGDEPFHSTLAEFEHGDGDGDGNGDWCMGFEAK